MRNCGAWLAIITMLSPLYGCGSSGDGQGSGSGLSISTIVEPTTVAAGENLDVTCLIEGESEATPSFQIIIDQTDGYEADGLSLTFTAVGTYAVACATDDEALVDDTPVEITVVPGAPFNSVATVDPPTTPPGAETTATCDVTDKYGNEISNGVTITVDPAEGVEKNGNMFSSTTAGEYEVACVHGDTEFDSMESAQWTVEAGAPTHFELAFDPDQLAYKKGDDIEVSGVTTDEYGNQTTGLLIQGLVADPDEDVIIKGDDKNILKIQEEGIYNISARSDDFPELEASATVVIDQTAPVLSIRNPARGITTDTMTEVIVEGLVSDNLGKIGKLEVVGQEVTPDDEGNFSVTVPLTYGTNLLIVEAEDPYGNKAEAGRAIVSSSYFYPMDPPSQETDGVKSGLVVLMSKEAIDDGDHDPENVDDLATIFEVVFTTMDLNTLIPNPIFKGPITQCEWLIEEISFDAPEITLTPQVGSLGLEVVMTNFKANLYNQGNDFVCLLNWDKSWHTGPIPITIDELTLTTDVAVQLNSEGTAASAENTDVMLDGLDFGAVDPLDWLSGSLSGVLELVFAGLIEDQVGSALGDVFSAFSINEEFEIPAFIDGMDPNALSLETVPTAIQFDPEFMRIALDALAKAATPKRPHEVLGSIAYAGCGPDAQPLTPPDAPLVIALHDDVLNQLLFGVWEGGTLSMDLSPEDTKDLDFGGTSLPVDDLALHLDPLLPLIFNSCGEGGNRIQIGDLYMEASFSMSVLGDADIAFWIQGEAAVEFAMVEDEDGKKLGFELQDLDPLILEVVRNEGLFEGDDAALRSLIKDQMLPELLGSLTGGLGSFPLPDIDLSGISPDIPEGTAISLDIQEFDRKGGYLVMKGALK